MVNLKNIGTGSVPLKLAAEITKLVNQKWKNGEFLEKISPITQDLLKFWFSESNCIVRNINFHEGQKQAILNTIYLHEVLKNVSVKDNYLNICPEILSEIDITDLEQKKYLHPKYCLKLATGTGKTWILHALIIWQYLNARYEQKDEIEKTNRFSQNFLLVAPGLIVYERLLDAFVGKENKDGQRDFLTSDFKQYEELFIPPQYKNELFTFIQSSILKKDDIAKRKSSNGMIAITNWHLLAGISEEEIEEINPIENPSVAILKLRPIAPGTSGGNSLDTLDRKYQYGNELEYLKNLPNLVVFNDEAHHIHEFKKAGETLEVEWQKSLNEISENKENNFIQIDFSATPYNVTGSGQNRTKQYFAHIIANFDLNIAISKGLVKLISIDKRKEIATAPLDFKAERENNLVVALSEGQKVMLRAGYTRLKQLEVEFEKLNQKKYPKMLIITEDTKVSPLVSKFFIDEGFEKDDVMQIDSNKKNEISLDEWGNLKQKLFNVDREKQPKIIISVLMLREGFDVNNICVIVPLRTNEAPILLEQVIGRGLRLMFREPEYFDIKDENRKNLLIKKEEPNNFLDMLFIIEHPAFMKFYEDLNEFKDSIIEIDKDNNTRITGDIETTKLKTNYENFDLFIPQIIKEKEELLKAEELDIEDLESFETDLDTLKKIVPIGPDKFYGEELTVKTRFGEYTVTGDIFQVQNYNEFLIKLVKNITSNFVNIGKRKSNKKDFPAIQINHSKLVSLIDKYIKNKLFNTYFDPLFQNNWKILFITQDKIIRHIIRNISKKIYQMLNNKNINDAIVERIYFSEVKELKIRENYSMEFQKCIYEKLGYPSNKGGFEKDFMQFCNTQTKINSFLKINENYHTFAHINYIRDDGNLSRYFPDFILKLNNNEIYLVETKADAMEKDINVKQKKMAAFDFITQINELDNEDRNNCKWYYCLLSESDFYNNIKRGGDIYDILQLAILTKGKAEGTLVDFVK